jgi:hypothetical protein
MSQNILPDGSQNKSADCRRYPTLLFEVVSDREPGDEKGVKAPGGAVEGPASNHHRVPSERAEKF